MCAPRSARTPAAHAPGVPPHGARAARKRKRAAARRSPTALTVRTSVAPCLCSLVGYPHEHIDVTLRRFSAARKHKLLPALDMLRAHVAWAGPAQIDLAALRRAAPHDVLGVPPDKVRLVETLFPHYHLGHDKEGRPITHIYGEHYAAQQLFALVPPERVGRFHVWRTERMLADMYARLASGAAPAPPGQMAVVISVAGMSMRHVTKDFLALVKLLSVVDQNHYPERCGSAPVCGAASAAF